MDDPKTKGPLSLRRERDRERERERESTCVPVPFAANYDARRTTQLEGMGYRVMRFWNHEVPGEIHHVLERIRAALIEAPSPRPSPGGEGVGRYCHAASFPEEPRLFRLQAVDEKIHGDRR
jgi:hypothetical protein